MSTTSLLCAKNWFFKAAACRSFYFSATDEKGFSTYTFNVTMRMTTISVIPTSDSINAMAHCEN